METPRVNDPSFWADTLPRVMVNPRDPQAGDEARQIRTWVKGQGVWDGHVFFATSGSMGKSKWVALSKQAMLASADAVNQFLGVDSSDRWLQALPDFHVGGMGIWARAHLSSSSVVSLGGRWRPAKYAEILAQEGVTRSSLVPTQLTDLVYSNICPPSCLRSVLIGGGRLNDEVYQRAMGLGWPVMETYGMTETASQVATARVGERTLRVLPLWQVRENEHSCLAVQGRALLTAYLRCNEQSVESLDPKVDGWFVTKDVARVNEGYLEVLGRKDRSVKLLGELVDLDRVASELGACVSVPGLEVVSIEDVRMGAVLVAVIEQKDGEHVVKGEIEKYNKHCHPLLRVGRVVSAEEIPRTPLGKVRYAALSDVVQRLLDAE
ncbi:AMP-binding protein [Verrucomicrobiaceae bacterium N1E253]|uniref:AMP-binding protein n=1 Tax=Oceaniferula marina TaxID=2748318 RepID=A0A851GR22_9BACT|nr:AMP-binding protein [Oceaniferula marina]NWK56644.1 AMP-binding protein [Oceaniferula marina]